MYRLQAPVPHHLKCLTTLHGDIARIWMALTKVALKVLPQSPGPLRTVQRAEYSGVILTSQALSRIHVGIDNLDVFTCVWQILDRETQSTLSVNQRW